MLDIFLFSLIEEVGTDKLAVNEKLSNVKDFCGVSGTRSFNENRDPSKPLFALQIQDGKFAQIER